MEGSKIFLLPMGIFIHFPYIYIYIRIELVPPPGIYNEMRDKLSTSTVAGSLDFLKYQQSGTLSPQQMALPQLSLFLAFLCDLFAMVK